METQTITQKYFTKEEANESLSYVGKITGDMMSKWKDIMSMSEEDRTANLKRMHEQDSTDLTKSSFPIDELRYYTHELIQLGCIVHNFEKGSVAFPTRIAGKKGYYLWQYGEDTVQEAYSVA